jgi:hypothetical protein
MISINQILLLRDSAYSMELGEALWSAFKEVENFYNDGEPRAIFRRYYMSEFIPDSIQKKDTGSALPIRQKMRNFFSGGQIQPEGQIIREEMRSISSDDSKWASTEGMYVRNYDASKIASLAWELAGSGPQEGWSRNGTMQVVVTDLVLVPPPNWRYIIWSKDVISIPPVDPKYWHMQESNRKTIIKHRVRTACLSVVGQLMGLQRCNNERCFLFRDVDSVTRLDDMVVLGPEHDIKALSQRGFEIFSIKPEEVQDIQDSPKGKSEW